MPCTGCW